MNLERIYHDCRKWEEVAHNMWGEAVDAKADLEQAEAFTGDSEIYGYFMMRVVKEWPISCENALTDYALNRKAWVGHAAVALALRIPEHITRTAWGLLTDEQRVLANRKAERAIQQWENSRRESGGVCGDMAAQVLF